MANKEQIGILKQGTAIWNGWRKDNPRVKPDLSKANLSGANFRGARFYSANLKKTNLSKANLRGADLREANLVKADLSRADLRGAKLYSAKLRGAFLGKADLRGANLSGADLTEAYLEGANLRQANLSRANFTQANLRLADLDKAYLARAILVETDFEEANLANCTVYGVSAWRLKLGGAKQVDLIITPRGEPTITVDNLEVAQFVCLLLNNEKIRDTFDTITSKVVLILGRFTKKRKPVLDAIRDALRRRNYLPVLFDFDKPSSRDMTESISTLAHMASFVIADITDARSIPQELEHIVPGLPSVPVQPLLQASAVEYSMFEHFKRYPWVLEIYHYKNADELLVSLEQKVIAPAEAKVRELLGKS